VAAADIDVARAEQLASELAADVLASLADDWLRTRVGVLRAALVAVALVSLDPTDALTVGTTVVRRAGRRLSVHLEQLGAWAHRSRGCGRT
jgi:hypothetical protein